MESPTPVTPPQMPEVRTGNNNSKIWFASLLAILSIVILALGYQNYSLNKEIALLKIPSPTQSPSPTTTPITTNPQYLAVIKLPTGYGIDPGNNPYVYPISFQVLAPQSLSSKLSAYGVSKKVIVGPKDWTGQGQVGADGTTSIALYPTGGSVLTGPHITYSEDPACVGCILGDAAQFFPSAKTEYLKQFPGPIDIPQGLQITQISTNLVAYTLPNTSDGMEVNGRAFYNNSQDMGYFVEMKTVMPPDQHELANFLLNNFASAFMNK